MITARAAKIVLTCWTLLLAAPLCAASAISAPQVAGDAVHLTTVSADVSAIAQEASSACRLCDGRQDDIWLVSVRDGGCSDDCAMRDKPEYSHYDLKQQKWIRSTAGAYCQGPDSKLPTFIWVHGDRIDEGEDRDVGREVHDELLRGHCDAPRLRFVIWSWPTSKVFRGPLKDVRWKAELTGPASYRLAEFLAGCQAAKHISLIGYSYGSRVVSGALHLLGGGTLDGRRLKARPDGAVHYNAVLLVPAEDDDWLEPGSTHGRALRTVDRVLIVYNSCDRVLAHYHWVYCRRSCAVALGSTGVADLGALGPSAAKLRQMDAACEVGKKHAWWLYFESAVVMREVRPYVLPAVSSTGRKPRVAP